MHVGMKSETESIGMLPWTQNYIIQIYLLYTRHVIAYQTLYIHIIANHVAYNPTCTYPCTSGFMLTH